MSSTKIDAKSLSYDANLPPFLRALHAQSSGGASAGGPDPILAGRRRAAKKRSSSEEAEDQPVIVDENGDVVEASLDGEHTVKDSNGEDDEARGGDESQANAEKEVSREREKVAGIGVTRKRKIGKVVGGEDGKVGEAAMETKSLEEDKVAKETDKAEKTDGTQDKPKKKKAKKIKLSFDPE